MTKVIGDYNAAVTIDGSTHYLLIQPGNSATAYNRINRNTLLGVSGQPADTSTAQTLTNKVLGNTNTVTVKDTLFTLQDNGDTSKQAVFELSGLTTATTRTYTLPDASTTIVGTGATQTLTNKTLTSPTITGGTYDNGTITVDAIGGHTSANIVTIAGLQINNGVLNTNNSVVTANIADSAVTPAKLQSGTGSGWNWVSWTPTWTNLTPGNGTVNYSKYIQIGKTVYFKLKFTFGSTTVVSGSIGISPPVNFNADATSATDTITSTGQFNDNSGQRWMPWVVFATSSRMDLAYIATTANLTVTSSTAPFTWAISDQIMLTGFYEVA